MPTINEEAIAILLNVLNYLHVDNKKKAFDEVIKALIKLREDNSTDTSAEPSVDIVDTSAEPSVDIVDTSAEPSVDIVDAPSVNTSVDIVAAPSVNTSVDIVAAPSVNTSVDIVAVPSVDIVAVPSVDIVAVPSVDTSIDTNIDTGVDISAALSVDTNTVYSSSVGMCADNSVKTSFDISVVTTASKSVITGTSKSVVSSNGKSVVSSSGKSVVTSGGNTVRSRWCDYEDEDDSDNDDNNKKTTFSYSQIVTSKIPTTIIPRENSKIVQVKPTEPVKKLPMWFTTIRYYDIQNYIDMSNTKSRDVNTILENMFALNMTNSKIISVKKYSEGVKIIFTIPDSEFKNALFKDSHSGVKYKLGNIIFSEHEHYHVPSQYK